MSEGKAHSFWTSLPGVLTGAASLLTALVALFTFLGHKGDRPSSGAPSDPKAVSAPLQNLDHCREFVGKWDWFIGGELRAEKSGHIDWRKDPSDPAPVVVGRWTCLNTKPKKVGISWQNGISESLEFSPDKKSVSGMNSINVRVSGTKKG